MLKKRISTLLIGILLVGAGSLPTSPAQAATPKIEILSPHVPTNYQLEDEITIKYKVSGFSPTRRNPIFLYLHQPTAKKRVFLRRISKVKEGENFYTYKIPTKFFERKRIKSEKLAFVVAARARVGNIWINGKSNKFFIKKSLPKTTEESAAADEEVEEDTEDKLPEAPTTSDYLILGNQRAFVARYDFRAVHEPWEVRKITIVNDADGDGFDADPNEATPAVDRVWVSYQDQDGNYVQRSGRFAANRAIISNMNVHVPRDGIKSIDVWANVLRPSVIGPNASGQTFKLGIQDTNNSDISFRAVGLISSNVDNTFSSIQLSSQTQNKEAILRRTIPTFKVLTPEQRLIIPGQNEVFEFSIQATGDTAVTLGRLVFDVNQLGLTTVDQAQFFREGNLLRSGDATDKNEVYLRWDAGATSCLASVTQAGPGSGMDCNGATQGSSKLIVSFSQEEIIPAGSTFKYKLAFNLQGIDKGDSFAIRFASGDETSKPSLGGEISTNGEIHNGAGTNELFSGDTDFASEATSISNRNIIWSDRSDNGHRHPTVNAGIRPTVSINGSDDFTNGYRLRINSLPSTTSTR